METTRETTRQQLIEVAERLFLDQGIEDVSLRTIVREAGQKNQSVLQYHFGGREGLVSAILSRRLHQIEAKRAELVEAALEVNPKPALRDACALLIRAPFLLCQEHKEFRDFLGQFGQKMLTSDGEINLEFAGEDLPSLRHMQTIIGQKLNKLDHQVLKLRLENTHSLGLLAMSRRARLGGSFKGNQAELFFNNLVDQVAAMLSAPVSKETLATLKK